MMPKTDASVSTVIPTHNPGDYLFRAIESVLNQSVVPEEIIVVDDGSETDVRSMLQENGYDTGHVEYTYQSNKGPAAARNLGSRIAEGTFLAFLDDDDEWTPDKIRKQLQTLHHLNCKMALCHSRQVNEQAGRSTYNELRIPDETERALRQYFRGNITCTIPGMLIQRKTFGDLDGFNEQLQGREDHEFMIRYLKKHDSCVLKEPLFVRHRRAEGRSETRDPNFLKKNAEVFCTLAKQTHSFPAEVLDGYWADRHSEIAFGYYLQRERLAAIGHCWKGLVRNKLKIKLYLTVLITVLFVPPDWTQYIRRKTGL